MKSLLKLCIFGSLLFTWSGCAGSTGGKPVNGSPTTAPQTQSPAYMPEGNLVYQGKNGLKFISASEKVIFEKEEAESDRIHVLQIKKQFMVYEQEDDPTHTHIVNTDGHTFSIEYSSSSVRNERGDYNLHISGKYLVYPGKTSPIIRNFNGDEITFSTMRGMLHIKNNQFLFSRDTQSGSRDSKRHWDLYSETGEDLFPGGFDHEPALSGELLAFVTDQADNLENPLKLHLHQNNVEIFTRDVQNFLHLTPSLVAYEVNRNGETFAVLENTLGQKLLDRANYIFEIQEGFIVTGPPRSTPLSEKDPVELYLSNGTLFSTCSIDPKLEYGELLNMEGNIFLRMDPEKEHVLAYNSSGKEFFKRNLSELQKDLNGKPVLEISDNFLRYVDAENQETHVISTSGIEVFKTKDEGYAIRFSN